MAVALRNLLAIYDVQPWLSVSGQFPFLILFEVKNALLKGVDCAFDEGEVANPRNREAPSFSLWGVVT
ncbi:hypothetical protein SBF1_3770007 [Candidatus Desulfosporosinus infrequens]|uniref:Uncharacterized protein n=1 Tax=Candidatus Desulfosporosinus infrequens TaxID=2043169 RepID=A0A2U3L551_9FIRM|nr:hypothetical protein SBF1_3770007 [Candidatus Desulfosporosinus infrequens]